MGSVLLLVAVVLVVVGLLAAVMWGRERWVRRTRFHLADLERAEEAGESALLEATAYLGERMNKGPVRPECPDEWRKWVFKSLSCGRTQDVHGTVIPSLVRRELVGDRPALSVSDVNVGLVAVTSPKDVTAGAVPHGVMEMSVTVRCLRDGPQGEITCRQRRLFLVTGLARVVTLVSDPLGTVIQ